MNQDILRTNMNRYIFGQDTPGDISNNEKHLLDKAFEFLVKSLSKDELNTFQLVDAIGSNWGIIRTTADKDTVSTLWTIFNTGVSIPGLTEEQYDEIEFPLNLSSSGFAKLLIIKGFEAYALNIDHEIEP